ncbi:thioredoxin-like protein [Podospora didyma]|uniref:Thioredoxin-like protein n=1 Tax=Podospora didyma TaxID=330526 RepID=A0AAE0K9N1_9PEZI|nr:thioredoxin-like protein [Podospora didyma]
MFGFRKTLDVVQLFHKPSVPSSVKVLSILKQASAAAAATSTEDQATSPATTPRPEFELSVTEEPPTTDQLSTILEYVGKDGIKNIVSGADTKAEALRAFKQNPSRFQWPVIVDWNRGSAMSGDNESAILKMLDALPKK